MGRNRFNIIIEGWKIQMSSERHLKHVLKALQTSIGSQVNIKNKIIKKSKIISHSSFKTF